MNKRGTKTKFSLSIIESLDFGDEQGKRLEGRILRDILRLSGHEVEYLYIRTRRELQVAIRRFYESRRRYLHISCHGNPKQIVLTLDFIPFAEFALDTLPYLRGRRLFMSACAVVNDDFAKVVIPESGCQSLIGPRKSICFDDAVLMWASFYHLMFRDPEIDRMKGGKIRWALRRIRYAFGIEFNYFRREDTKKGYSKVDIDKMYRSRTPTISSTIKWRAGCDGVTGRCSFGASECQPGAPSSPRNE